MTETKPSNLLSSILRDQGPRLTDVYREYQIECPECKGDGRGIQRDADWFTPCRVCGGQGFVDRVADDFECLKCFDTGRVQVMQSNGLFSTETVKCPKCIEEEGAEK